MFLLCNPSIILGPLLKVLGSPWERELDEISCVNQGLGRRVSKGEEKGGMAWEYTERYLDRESNNGVKEKPDDREIPKNPER